ncbi:SRPBCC family protein [Puniceicoccales bacterium CK1056]|uniref:SRPBCC family protein n=1 Tax=Oceanipulchritudo coccoides TaxID=2706888 RepID=A0A6B2LZR8_9BACT|nr:SRPBCC family protein [Oceanipulchritudo coccoides]NDV61943.1 SRPBCC family protein [Oceanipulchritudo coccoides]
MKIITKRTFRALPLELWEIIHNPSNMPAWNPKCLTCKDIIQSEPGRKFAVTYKMKGKHTDAVGELISSRKEKLIHFRYFYEDKAKVGTVDEVFEIIPAERGKTLLIHTVDFSKSTLPYWVKLLIGFLGRFGKSMGRGPMDGIASLLQATRR